MQDFNDIDIKCFDPLPVNNYLDYMGNILQRKRIESEYIHRATNAPRHKDRECVWNQSDQWKAHLKRILRHNYEYWAFCDECMGSDDELPLVLT